MRLEDTSNPLHDFGRWLFTLIDELAGRDGGEPVYQKGGWYRAPRQGKVCLYLYFLGKSGRTKHPNTVHLTTLWDEEFNSLPWVERGNNWFGSVSADFYARPDDPAAKERAELFIRRAFKAVAVAVYSEGVQAEEARREFAEKAAEITQDTPQAPAAAKWINQKLSEAGMATARAVREILVNVASEVARKILLGG